MGDACDHPGISHGLWSYAWPCPKCGVCRFIGPGPLCLPCATAAESKEVDHGRPD